MVTRPSTSTAWVVDATSCRSPRWSARIRLAASAPRSSALRVTRGLQKEQPILRGSPPFHGQGAGFALDVLNLEQAVGNSAGPFDLRQNMNAEPLLLFFESVPHFQAPSGVRKSGQYLTQLLEEQIAARIALERIVVRLRPKSQPAGTFHR